MSDTVVLPESPVAGVRQGDVIAGKYRLDHELGRGAMGTVWAATHTTLGQKVAIKLIGGDQVRSPEARHRFSLEAKAAARLKSRHAVQVYDDGETPEGVPYIVMEYLDGETLEARLERQHDIGLPEAIRVTTHVGRALAKAHARGIVHRDLKSGNVFIARTDDDELGWIAKVLDFGVAKLTDMASASTTKTGTIVGTPLFMSPEQIRGASHVDHRADLYSLGMVFYNMVTGVHAFNGPSYSDVLVAICTEPLPEIREKAPWLPVSVSDWFGRACARELVDRFQSADEMIEALREAAGPNSRLSRGSVPEEVGGPSGTLVGHVPPHAMATLRVEAPEVDLVPPTNENTLRSRTGPFRARESRGNSEPRVSITESKRSWGYPVLALFGASAALALVIGALVLRFVVQRWLESDRPHPASTKAALPSALAPKPLPEEPVRIAPEDPRPSPPSEAPPERPAEAVPERPRSATLPAGRPRAVHVPATKPPASAAPETPKPPSRPAAPDMGF